MRMHPAYKDLPTGQQHIWAATEDGIGFTVDGADNWTIIALADLGVPTNDAGDSPAPAAADMTIVDVGFCPQDPDRIYVVGTTTSPNNRAWLYKTDDYGTTWSNTQVGTP
jgi:hypothetical protein